MTCLAGRFLLCLSLVFAGACSDDPRIGLVLVYQAKRPAAVVRLNFDEHVIMGARAGVMHLTAGGWKEMALNRPRAMLLPPREIAASWSYVSTEKEASSEGDPDKPPWKQAEARVPVRSPTKEELKLMRSNGHRVKLRLLFDGDRLDVHWELEPTRNRR